MGPYDDIRINRGGWGGRGGGGGIDDSPVARGVAAGAGPGNRDGGMAGLLCRL